MGSNLSLIHLPAQSGKTRKITELINKWNLLISSSTSSDDKNLNIIFTSNTKLLTKQTASRIRSAVDDMSDLSDEEEVEDDDSLSLDCESVNAVVDRTLAWISSNGTRALSVNDVFTDYVLDDKCDNIICCSNAARMNHVAALIEKLRKLNGRNKYAFDRKINIWVDEADACMSVWKKHIRSIQEMNEGFVQNVVLVTATMMQVYKYLMSVGLPCNVRAYECTHPDAYVKYSETHKIMRFSNTARNTAENLINVIDSNADMCVPGTKWFCPGDKNRASHDTICEELLVRGFNVMIINGVNKEIRFADRSPPIDISEYLDNDLEIAKTLNRIYYEHHLYLKPFAVTGQLCVGRGITFASQIDGKEFLFTHGVIPDMSSGDDGYQLVARCFGNIREYATYKRPIVFISEKMDAKITAQEDFVLKFAATLYLKNDGMDVVSVTRSEIANMSGDNSSIAANTKPPRKKYASNDKEHRVFEDETEASDFIMVNFGEKIQKRSGIAPKTFTEKANGENPTTEDIVKRMWGLDKNNKYRMVPTNEGKWCVYWRPSDV